MSTIYRLFVPGKTEVEIASRDELKKYLMGVQALSNGAIVLLAASDRDYIKAKAMDGLWEICRRRGGWWTKQSFTSGLSTGLSERMSRSNRDFMKWFDQREQMRFENDQLIELFTAHFQNRKYPFPYLGA